ncbi:MAG: hypothetical protein JW746_08280 [Candidatus Krumholzibacteriota bacterium]|nr:hypothetical protein [Candidatus Krumholzibacteriota bacterium]
MNCFINIFRRLGIAVFIPMIPVILFLSQGCGHSGDSLPEKGASLTPDEEYIVQLYMKINELEKNLQDNPSDSLKKWEAMKEEIDQKRVLRTIEALKEDPERWYAVFSRIELLMEPEKP